MGGVSINFFHGCRANFISRARATSAAPTFFKPFIQSATKEVFQDGALSYNNPVNVANAERQNLWPSADAKEPDLLLSIGTGYSSKEKRRRADRLGDNIETGLSGGLKQLLRIAFDAIDSTLDSNRTWDDFHYGLTAENRWRYKRMNIDLDKPPALDEVAAIKDLEAKAKAALIQDPKVKEIAHRLVASLFYFTLEKVEVVGISDANKNQYHCTGKNSNASATLQLLFPYGNPFLTTVSIFRVYNLPSTLRIPFSSETRRRSASGNHNAQCLFRPPKPLCRIWGLYQQPPRNLLPLHERHCS